jgi:hypothetical protein
MFLELKTFVSDTEIELSRTKSLRHKSGGNLEKSHFYDAEWNFKLFTDSIFLFPVAYVSGTDENGRQRRPTGEGARGIYELAAADQSVRRGDQTAPATRNCRSRKDYVVQEVSYPKVEALDGWRAEILELFFAHGTSINLTLSGPCRRRLMIQLARGC